MNSKLLLKQFKDLICEIIADVEVVVDYANSKTGVSWIDIKADDFFTSLSFKPNVGFGVYTTGGAYGERPDEIFKTYEKAAKRVRQIFSSVNKNGELSPLNLMEIRNLTGISQVSMAEALKIKQPSIARIEKRTDVKLSSLVDYVEVLGGRLETRVVFDDMEAVFELSKSTKVS